MVFTEKRSELGILCYPQDHQVFPLDFILQLPIFLLKSSLHFSIVFPCRLFSDFCFYRDCSFHFFLPSFSLALSIFLCPFELTNFTDIDFYFCGKSLRVTSKPCPLWRIDYFIRAVKLSPECHTLEKDGEWLFCFYTWGTFPTSKKGR